MGVTISAAQAGRLLLHAQGLLDDPAAQPPATPSRVGKLIERMGFVQLDTISTVERAHHLILAGRLNGYRPEMLTTLLERDRRLFEHWTHDASVIPIKWYPHWKPRFERYRMNDWHRRRLGDDGDAVIASVLGRVTREGPLTSRDFEHEREGPSAWWGWKPPKAALEYLWRTGRLHVVGRRNFQKVYDLTERAVPEYAAMPRPAEDQHVDWACRTALRRLGAATVREVAQFWALLSVRQARDWVAKAEASGDVLPVTVESADGSPPRRAYALADFRPRLRRLPQAAPGMRLLCPFDPVLRDRARARRLFGFDFRFEGFVPAADRKHGYYVMAILDGDRFVGKADPKFDRAAGTLRVHKVWWEPAVRPTPQRHRSFEAAVQKLAAWVGAARVELPAEG
jgi:uncharacterized protein YcaQ